jgi:two-component system nitrogen regulation response regulator GlnG/two-component system response regulator HydG
MFDLEDTLERRFDKLQASASSSSETVLGLVIAWSRVERSRIGEVTLFRRGARLLFGRGGARDGDPAPRLTLLRHRPGQHHATEPLSSQWISRCHLLLERRGDLLTFERLGKLPALVNGVPLDRGTLHPGDCLSIEQQLIFICVRRRLELAHARYPPPSFDFGAPDPGGMVGESEAMWSLREALAFHAQSSAHVLLLGPSGTGKELAARSLHLLSPRGDRPLVARNAATVPDTLIDAELFGHARNYPNPGMRERSGLIGEAEGSTLFLDEIGEAPPGLQAHLLRLLDGGEYHRLGESMARRADVRFVGATNRAVSELKHDFAARFAVRIAMPTLQARREDIPLLVQHLVRRAAERGSGFSRFIDDDGYVRIDPAFMERLLQYPFTLHIRELEEMLTRAAAASGGDTLVWSGAAAGMASVPLPRATVEASSASPPAAKRSAPPTEQEILASLARNGGNRNRVWRELGLRSRFALYRLLKKVDSRES